ncbi:MAG: competence protein ComEA [Cognaticolwellia sp.]|jgi:competence protein ComEA
MRRLMSILSKHLLATCLLALCLTFLLPGVAMAGVNVNTASTAELQTLPGIGPSKANAIVAYRSENGPFSSLNALDAVPGIGPSTLQNISPLVEFGKSAALPSAGTTTTETTAASTAVLSAPTEPKAERAPKHASGSGVNINVASAAELESLSGIGAAKAAAIIENRQVEGPFSSCQDLTRVSGIGQATVANMGSDCSTE